VLFAVCINKRDDVHPLLVRPAPIRLPSLARRMDELPWIIHEYAADAITELRMLLPGYSDADRTWVLEHAATSLAEIEKLATRSFRVQRELAIGVFALGPGSAGPSTTWRRRIPRCLTNGR
jgi:hypothetical protein